MKYYKVIVTLGHLGKCHGVETTIYVEATSMMKAVKVAQKLPGVKHSKMPSKAVEITEEEYRKGIESQNYYNRMDQIFNV